MKIYTQRQITEIENQTLNKIYFALQELNERDNADESGAVASRHDELLDLALKHLSSPPTSNVYGWIKRGKLEGRLL